MSKTNQVKKKILAELEQYFNKNIADMSSGEVIAFENVLLYLKQDILTDEKLGREEDSFDDFH